MTNPNPQHAAPPPPSFGDWFSYRSGQIMARFNNRSSNGGTTAVPMKTSIIRAVLIVVFGVLAYLVGYWGLFVDWAFWVAFVIGIVILIAVKLLKKAKTAATGAATRVPSWVRTAAIAVGAIVAFLIIQNVWNTGVTFVTTGVSSGVLATFIVTFVGLATIALCARVPATAKVVQAPVQDPTNQSAPPTGQTAPVSGTVITPNNP